MIERAVVEAAAELVRSGEDHVIATVVRVIGPGYRRPGARMIATRERWIAGSVSGGCLEADIARKAWWQTTDHRAAVIGYDSRDPDEPGTGCGGAVEILVERRRSGAGIVDPIDVLARVDRTQRRAALATVFRAGAPDVPVGGRVCVIGGAVEADASLPDRLRHALAFACEVALETGEASCGRIDGCDVVLELIVPRPRLFVLGSGHDAVPVARLARAIGWDAVVAAAHARPIARDRFAGIADELIFGIPSAIGARIEACARAAVVVMAHDYALDRAHLEMVLGTTARYIGVLGPRARTDRMFADLGLCGDTRVHAPVGLRLGAETPDEIAMAIVAEVQAAMTGASATSLREPAVVAVG